MLKAGIVGLPNVGKSTLFNAVTRTRKAEAANYPFCTIDPNVGIVSVPDPRLAVLSKISGSQKLVPAAIEEILRIDGPLATNRRTTTCPVEIGGRSLPAGAHSRVQVDRLPDLDQWPRRRP